MTMAGRLSDIPPQILAGHTVSFLYPVVVDVSETPGRFFIVAVFDFNGGQFPRFRIVDDQIHLGMGSVAPEVKLPRETEVAPVLRE